MRQVRAPVSLRSGHARLLVQERRSVPERPNMGDGEVCGLFV